MTDKQFYSRYEADDNLSELSAELINLVRGENPVHILDFGSGSGKHSNAFNQLGIYTICLDISFQNTMMAKIKYKLPCVICADEHYLRNLANCDVVITCSVLDHIENVDGIIGEFKRIANRTIFLAETNSFEGNRYYRHNYEKHGFKRLDFKWKSDPDTGDGGTYYIWMWKKGQEETVDVNDDLGIYVRH